jgi:UDP-glucose 4-epimerase
LKVLVTGGSGFVGSHLLIELKRLGCEVVLDFQHGIDAIFHLSACDLTDSLHDPKGCLRVNVNATLAILENMRCRCAKAVLVFASSGSVYGEPLYTPQDEKHPVQPTNPYTISKVASENYINFYAKHYGLKTVILRLYNVVGTNQNPPRVVSLFVNKILHGEPIAIEGNGNQKRCFTHVKDVVQANLLASTTEEAYGSTFNIASDRVVTVKELAYLIGRLLDKPVNCVFKESNSSDINSFEPDITLAKKVLGYLPTHSLEEAIMEIAGEQQ